MVTFGLEHSYRLPYLFFALFLRGFSQIDREVVFAVEKQVPLLPDLLSFNETGGISDGLKYDLALAAGNVDCLRVARELGLRPVPFDPRCPGVWDPSRPLDVQMMQILDENIFSKGGNPLTVVFSGNNHAKALAQYDCNSVHDEDGELVHYDSTGPSLGYLLRGRFGDRSRLISTDTDEWRMWIDVEDFSTVKIDVSRPQGPELDLHINLTLADAKVCGEDA